MLSARAPRPAASSRRSRTAAAIGWTVVGLALWLVHLRLPIQSGAPDDLDHAWQQSLARALIEGVRYGSDLVFTFGPLSPLHNGRFEPDLWWPKLVLWEGLWKGAVAWRWAAVVRARPDVARRVGLLAALVLVDITDDTWFLLLAFALGMRHTTGAPARMPLVALDCVLLAAGGLVKFPYFVAGAAVVAALAAQRALRRPRDGLLVAGVGAAAILALWIACRQSPLDLPLWFARCAHLSGLYAEGQGAEGGELVTAIGCALVAATAGLAWSTWRGWRPRAEAACAAGLFASLGYLAFRLGFTIPEQRNQVFFGIAVVVPFLVVRPPQLDAPTLRARRVGTVVLWATVAVAGWAWNVARGNDLNVLQMRLHEVEREVLGLTELDAHRAKLEQSRAVLAQRWALPRVRAAVGDGTVAQLGVEQPLVFLNDLRWRPFPMLQTYLALSPSLAALDAEFLRGPHAPDFVLYRPGTIDSRLPLLDDSAAALALLAEYDVRLEERTAILFERRAEPRVVAPGVEVMRRTVRFGETIDLAAIPGRTLWMRVRVRPTVLGKLRAALLRPVRVSLCTRVAGRAEIEYRAPVGMLDAGFLVRPLMSGNPDWVTQLVRQDVGGIDAISVTCELGPAPWLDDEIEVVVERRDDTFPKPDRSLNTELPCGWFAWRPTRARASIGPWPELVQERQTMLVGARSTLAFDVPAEGGRLVALGGVRALADGTVGTPVRFRALLVAPGGVQTEIASADVESIEPAVGASRVLLKGDIPAGPIGRQMWLETRSVDPTKNPPRGFALAFWADVDLVAPSIDR